MLAVLPKKALFSKQLVQISGSKSEDGFNYLSYLKPYGENSFMASFHEGSLLLDKVRLFGETKVLIVFKDETAFQAVLSYQGPTLGPRDQAAGRQSSEYVWLKLDIIAIENMPKKECNMAKFHT